MHSTTDLRIPKLGRAVKYFYVSFLLSAVGIGASFLIGSLHTVYICTLLAVLEVSISFDNAVINAKVLSGMSELWRRRFITYGIPIAVFGMRLVFPLMIVSFASGMSMSEAMGMALWDKERYQAALESSKGSIYTFGSAFLLMVFLDFLLDRERKVKWIKTVEDSDAIRYLSRVPYASIGICASVGFCIWALTGLWSAYLSALLLYVIIRYLNEVMNSEIGGGVAQQGAMGFLYLEVLDASFSLDGVIGAMALSDDIFTIMIGLGIGAIFVRSITIYLVETKALKNFTYLEHGAHYAILALAMVMIIKLFGHVSEIITGITGIGLIVASLISSWKTNRA